MLTSPLFFNKSCVRLVPKLAMVPLAALLLTPAASAHAAGAKDEVELKFDVYSGGLRIFKISLGMQISEADYAVRVAIKSKGLISLFAKTKINMNAEGRARKGKITPVSYSSKAKSKGRRRTVKMSWNSKGRHKVKRDFDLSAYKSKRLSETVRPGMVDPLSYLMKLVARPAKTPCSGTELVYDGRYVAEYRYSLQGVSSFNRSAGGAYHGKAYKCLLNYRSIAGGSLKKQKKQAGLPPPRFTVWFAPIAGATQNLFVPVAVDGEYSGRSFTLRLSGGSISGQALTSRVIATK